MAKIQRKELKRPDAFVTTGRQWLEWGITHQRTLAMAGVGIAVLVLLAAGASRYRVVQERQANEDLAAALSLFREERWPEAGRKMREVAERWSNRGVASVASFYAAQASLEAGDHGAAKQAFTELTERRDLPKYLRQQAYVGLGFVAAESGDDGDAAAQYAQAVGIGGPYTAVAMLGEARARLALGERDRAKALYEQFLQDFPASPERTTVEGVLAGL